MSKAKGLTVLSEVTLTEAEHMKLATKRSLIKIHSSHASGSDADEGTGGDDDDEDDEEKGNDDEQASDEEEFIHPSLSTHTKEETRDEERFNPISKTPENNDDEGNGKEDLGLNVGREEGHDEEEEEDELYKDGLYHKRNVDFAYLMWEDFVYQVEHKDTKKSNEMCYPRFTKVIIYHFLSKDPSIPRRNKVNWHYVRDDHMFSTIKLTHISQASGLGAYKGAGSIPRVPDVPTDEFEEEISWNSTDEEGDDDEGKDGDGNGKENLGINVGREEGHDEEEEEDELYKDVIINLRRGIQL
nr:hypothetical protein [Tanacetum cinerariifolium]